VQKLTLNKKAVLLQIDCPIYECPENFWDSLTMPTDTFFQKTTENPNRKLIGNLSKTAQT